MSLIHTINQFKFAITVPSRVLFKNPESYIPPPNESETEGDDEVTILTDEENEAHLHGEDPAEAMTAQTKQEGEKTWTGLWENMKKTFTNPNTLAKSKLKQRINKDVLDNAVNEVIETLQDDLSFDEMNAMGEQLLSKKYFAQPKTLVNTIGVMTGIPARRMIELVQLAINKLGAGFLVADNKFGPESKKGFDALNRMLHPNGPSNDRPIAVA